MSPTLPGLPNPPRPTSAGAMRSSISTTMAGSTSSWSMATSTRRWILCPPARAIANRRYCSCNQRNGTFTNVSASVGPAFQINRVSRGLAVGDLFNDGRLEIVIENLTGAPLILRNQIRPRQSLAQPRARRHEIQSPRHQCTRPRHRRRSRTNARSPERRQLHLAERSPPPLRPRRTRPRRQNRNHLAQRRTPTRSQTSPPIISSE